MYLNAHKLLIVFKTNLPNASETLNNNGRYYVSRELEHEKLVNEFIKMSWTEPGWFGSGRVKKIQEPDQFRLLNLVAYAADRPKASCAAPIAETG